VTEHRYTTVFTTPPSTRSAKPLVAEAGGEHTSTIRLAHCGKILHLRFLDTTLRREPRDDELRGLRHAVTHHLDGNVDSRFIWRRARCDR